GLGDLLRPLRAVVGPGVAEVADLRHRARGEHEALAHRIPCEPGEVARLRRVRLGGEVLCPRAGVAPGVVERGSAHPERLLRTAAHDRRVQERIVRERWTPPRYGPRALRLRPIRAVELPGRSVERLEAAEQDGALAI